MFELNTLQKLKKRTNYLFEKNYNYVDWKRLSFTDILILELKKNIGKNTTNETCSNILFSFS